MSSNASTEPQVKLPSEILAFAEAIKKLPAEHREVLETAFAKVKETHLRRAKLLSAVDAAVSELRSTVKYVQFDLQATRRERDEFRSTLENRGF